MNEPVTLLDLAEELGVRKQWLFTIAERLGVPTGFRRDSGRGGQRVATVTHKDAGLLRSEVLEAREGGSTHAGAGSAPPDDAGFFYIVQLEPQHEAGRYKVGFTLDLESRLQKHRTAAPFAQYLETWPCRRKWESAAIDCVTSGSESVRREVFRAQSLHSVVERAKRFFTLMPASSMNGPPYQVL